MSAQILLNGDGATEQCSTKATKKITVKNASDPKNPTSYQDVK